MKTAKNKTDELRPEYDLYSLPVRKLGPGRKSFGPSVVRLEPDVAEAFPDAVAVNNGLRVLIQIKNATSGLDLKKAGKTRAKTSRSRHSSGAKTA